MNKLTLTWRPMVRSPVEDAVALPRVRILQGPLGMFVNFDEPQKEEPSEQVTELAYQSRAFSRRSTAGAFVRSANCLKNDNIVYIASHSEDRGVEMLPTPNFGPASRMNEIKEVLASMGLSSAAWKCRIGRRTNIRRSGQRANEDQYEASRLARTLLKRRLMRMRENSGPQAEPHRKPPQGAVPPTWPQIAQSNMKQIVHPLCEAEGNFADRRKACQPSASGGNLHAPPPGDLADPQTKPMAKRLFDEIAPRYADRNGGYLR